MRMAVELCRTYMDYSERPETPNQHVILITAG